MLAFSLLPRNLSRWSGQFALAKRRATSVSAAAPGRGSEFLSLRAFVRHGVLHFPVSYMRGGTSTGVVIWGQHLRPFQHHRDEIIRKIMGVPDEGEIRGNTQITGLGRGPSTSNKVMIVEPSDGVHADFKSTLAQLAAEKSSIDWTVNCGNMSSALPLFLLINGLLVPTHPTTHVRIHNTNTGVITDCSLRTPHAQPAPPDDTEIPGVSGAYPWVQLSMRQPVGSITGHLLPTGRTRDVFEGVEASCVDVAVPMVILPAAALGLLGDESVASLNANSALKQRLRAIHVAAGRAMRLKKKGVLMTEDELASSETIPKLCLVSPPKSGGNISVRYFTPQESHASLAVTGGCCLAAACFIPGTTAHAAASGLNQLQQSLSDHLVSMENPAGILRARVCGRHMSGGELDIPWVAYERSAQLFVDGFFRVHGASAAALQCAQALDTSGCGSLM